MVYLMLASGFEEAEAICPLDLLRRAGAAVETVSITKEKRVRGAHGIVIEADRTIDEVAGTVAQAVILPGGMPGAENLRTSEETAKLITACYENGGIAAAICAAPMVLGGLGLLRGKEAICYPGFEDRLTGAAIKKRAVVTDGRVVTAIGPGAAYEFGLKLVELLTDRKTAEKIARGILPVG